MKFIVQCTGILPPTDTMQPSLKPSGATPISTKPSGLTVVSITALYHSDFSDLLLNFSGTVRERLSMQNVSLILNRKNLSFQLPISSCYFCAERLTTISPYGQSSSLIEIS